ncbi:MAG: hypothetical protein ACKO6N_12820 [Myxococcota bacterium]
MLPPNDPQSQTQESPPSPPARRWHYPYFLPVIGVGIVHGLMARLAFGYEPLKDVLGVMTISFIYLVPFTIGLITVYLGEQEQRLGWATRLTLPLLPAFLALVAALALAWEGIICIILWLPLYLLMAALGGLVAGILRSLIDHHRNRNLTFASLMVLPFLSAPLEKQLELPQDQRIVQTYIDIQAAPEVVWQNIIRVPRFKPEEQRTSLSHLIGFPKPLEATLSHEGIGGIRHATFEGNVLFIETITAWEPLERLTFAIKADAESIPPTTLDQHVTVGGPYFDVLEGEYRLEKRDPETVRLHLHSIHRVSTQFNLYSSLWTDFIMRDVQNHILDIIKHRCEHTVALR